jgi:hypothetical protein
MGQSDEDILLDAITAREPEPPDELPPIPSSRIGSEGWKPKLNPTQYLIFDEVSEVLVGHGPKGSGKSMGFLHKIVRHCYENNNALALIIGSTARVATEGAGHDLVDMVLPAWKDGNRDRDGRLLDGGIGLEFTHWKLDPVTKDRHLWISTRFGGWSKVLLVSIPYGKLVKSRLFGIQPSLVYVDELHNCDTDEYYTFSNAQLGRRRGIAGYQQWMASTNPERPKHWTYRLLFEDCVVATGGKTWPNDPEKPGIRRDEKFAIYQVPFSENEDNLPPGYAGRLVSTFRKDKTMYARMIEGKWVDYPSGQAIFKHDFSEQYHIIGDSKKGTGIVPRRDVPIIIGYDTGQVHTGISFMQCVETKYGPMWLVFDELCYYGQRIPYRKLTRSLLAKIAYWNRRMEFRFHYWSIGDDQATTQYSPNTGSTTSRDIQDFSREIIAESSAFEGIQPIRIIGCPKPPGSKSSRVELTSDLLQSRMLVVSASCEWHRNMFLHLEGDDSGGEFTPKRGRYIHTFDSMTYPIYHRRYVRRSGYPTPDNIPAVSIS